MLSEIIALEYHSVTDSILKYYRQFSVEMENLKVSIQCSKNIMIYHIVLLRSSEYVTRQTKFLSSTVSNFFIYF